MEANPEKIQSLLDMESPKTIKKDPKTDRENYYFELLHFASNR